MEKSVESDEKNMEDLNQSPGGSDENPRRI